MPNSSQNLKLSSPTGTLVSCQKAVRVNKKREAEDKTDVRVDNIFKRDILEAMADLKGASFKLYMYILSNQDGYIFGLSQKDVANRAGLPEATYRTAVKELIDKILERKIETSNIEFKSAKEGYPEKIYDSLSSFSNTDG